MTRRERISDKNYFNQLTQGKLTYLSIERARDEVLPRRVKVDGEHRARVAGQQHDGGLQRGRATSASLEDSVICMYMNNGGEEEGEICISQNRSTNDVYIAVYIYLSCLVACPTGGHQGGGGGGHHCECRLSTTATAITTAIATAQATALHGTKRIPVIRAILLRWPLLHYIYIAM